MTATTTAPGPTTPGLEGIRLSFAGLLRSEWIKLRTLRSTWWCYALLVLLSIGFGMLMSATVQYTMEAAGAGTSAAAVQDAQRAATVQVATVGTAFTQLIVAVLGVLIIGGEYGTGMIRSTLTAAPGRLGAYFAKMLVLGVTTFVVGAVSIFGTALATLPVLTSKGLDVQLGEPSVYLPLLAASLYLAIVAALSYGFGAIIRNTAGGVATIVGIVFVLPIAVSILIGATQAKWIQNVAAFLPDQAGSTFSSYQHASGLGPAMNPDPGIITLEPWQALLVLAGWLVLVCGAGALLLKRRDA